MTTYCYAAVKYSPLSRLDAIKCLQDLVKGLKVALDELHALKMSHNDVRLPNICFNSNFDPVFIDVDRCHQLKQILPNVCIQQ